MIRFQITRTSGGPKPKDGGFKQTSVLHWSDRPDQTFSWTCIEFETLDDFLAWAREIDEDVMLHARGSNTSLFLVPLDHFKGCSGDPLPHYTVEIVDTYPC